uniref:BLOC-1-related complex subunit 7 n=1 Tax=Geospiza parvula TaxID=87175 RepID=A0A8U8AKN5_GEOPR
MAAGGAADAQARFGHSVKGLLTEKVTSCGTDVIALTKQVLKGSRSAELLGQAARNMVMQEDAILHSEDVSCVLVLEQQRFWGWEERRVVRTVCSRAAGALESDT